MSSIAKQVMVFNAVLIIANVIAFFLLYEFSAVSTQSLQFSYGFNVLLTLIFTNLILILQNTLKQFLGFVFLAQLTLKIIAFMLLKKFYVADRFELSWLAFFVPYIICLITEVSTILYLLKIKDQAGDFSSEKS
ncbi:MAG: hypothetical protein RI558_08650 [Psychroflexus sp.]|nr:hypothetical protein [Psychroflexus sp.]